jgi:cullin 1
MILDTNLSKELTDKFKRMLTKSTIPMDYRVDFDVIILGNNVWPLEKPDDPFLIPREILPIYEHFSHFYEKAHSGRKLTWLWHYSRNEIRTSYLNQRYTFFTSSHQMAILLQYSKNDTSWLDELCMATEITKKVLEGTLAVLMKIGVLVNEEPDQYDLNLRYRSKKVSGQQL